MPRMGVKMATKKRTVAIAEFVELMRRGWRDKGRKKPYTRWRMT